jgi:hypothetical protein
MIPDEQMGRRDGDGNIDMTKRAAAESPPKLIPPESLTPGDNAGIDCTPPTQRWRDGGRVAGGAKPHLSGGLEGGDPPGVA